MGSLDMNDDTWTMDQDQKHQQHQQQQQQLREGLVKGSATFDPNSSSSGVDKTAQAAATAQGSSSSTDDSKKEEKQQQPAGLMQLLADPSVLVFLWRCVVMGFGLGVLGTYEFLYLKQLGAPETLIGMALLVSRQSNTEGMQAETGDLQCALLCCSSCVQRTLACNKQA